MRKIEDLIGKYLDRDYSYLIEKQSEKMVKTDKNKKSWARNEKLYNITKAARDFYMKMEETNSQKKMMDFLYSLLNQWGDNKVSYSPDQEKAIYNISMGIQKMSSK